MAERHILLVDDEPNLQESMKIGLELRGYDVTVASSGPEAITDVLEEDDLPAALLDGSTTSADGGQSYAHLPLREARDAFEQIYIKELLTKTGGNITHASKMAGKKYEIDAKSFADK